MRALARFLTCLDSAILALLVLIAGAEAAAWALFEISWAAASEIQGLLMICFGLLSAALGIRQGHHLGVEALTRGLPPKLRLGLDRFAALSMALFGALVGIYGLRLAQTVGNTLPGTGWPAALQYVPAAVIGASMVLFALERLVHPEPGGE